jgi:hypothetical protein
MLPLWLGTGPGAEERRSIAVVVIGGQSLSLLLTLIMTPVAYSLLDDASQGPRWRKLTSLLQRRRPAPPAAAKSASSEPEPQAEHAAQ